MIDRISKYITSSVKMKPIDYSNQQSDFVLLERKYGVPFGIRSLKAVQTKNGLTKRNLLVITHNNDVKFDNNFNSKIPTLLDLLY